MASVVEKTIRTIIVIGLIFCIRAAGEYFG